MTRNYIVPEGQQVLMSILWYDCREVRFGMLENDEIYVFLHKLQRYLSTGFTNPRCITNTYLQLSQVSIFTSIFNFEIQSLKNG